MSANPLTDEESQPERGPSYQGLKFIADYARIALEDLGRLYGTHKGYNTLRIREHLEATGGDTLIKNQRRPTAALSQAIKRSDYFVREEGGINWLKEWVDKPEPEPQLEEPMNDLGSRGFELQKRSEDNIESF